MIRGILAFAAVVLGLAGCSATSNSRPEPAASNWTEGTNWQGTEVTKPAPDAYTLSAGDVSLPLD
jgi:hypothetical protein